MKAIVFDTHAFERPYFTEENRARRHDLEFLELRLTEQTAQLANGFPVVCVFAHDHLNAAVLGKLKEGGTRFLALRSAGFNHVDLQAAAALGLKVARVPAYSPYAIAEHAVGLILALNRKICRASSRVRELNFSLDGLVGFDLHGRTVGVVGAGRIGAVFARIMLGFGCKVFVHDLLPDESLAASGARYCSFDELLAKSDIVSLHLPLTHGSKHLINQESILRMKQGAMLINTSRGGLIDAKALIEALKNGQIGFAGLDVYEEEENVFFQDLSASVLQDDVLARLMTFPNVIITAHQAFLTEDALRNIVATTLANIDAFEQERPLENEVRLP